MRANADFTLMEKKTIRASTLSTTGVEENQESVSVGRRAVSLKVEFSRRRDRRSSPPNPPDDLLSASVL